MSEYIGEGRIYIQPHGWWSYGGSFGWWAVGVRTDAPWNGGYLWLYRNEIISIESATGSWWVDVKTPTVVEPSTQLPADWYWGDWWWNDWGFWQSGGTPVTLSGNATLVAVGLLNSNTVIDGGVTFSFSGEARTNGTAIGTADGTITFSGNALVATSTVFSYGWYPTYGWWNNRLGWWWDPNEIPSQQWKDF